MLIETAIGFPIHPAGEIHPQQSGAPPESLHESDGKADERSMIEALRQAVAPAPKETRATA
jgi:hypothetical protein